jgi:hypothetical protein
MRKRISAALMGVATLALAAAFAAPVAAAPVGGCPTGDDWRLEPISNVIPEVDNGNYGDQNGDGFGCARTNSGQSSKHEFESWTWKDNTNKL